MATQQQIDANRRNAEKSTGPVTPEGKAAVRLNAVRHGLRARTIAPDPEKDTAFTQLCAGLEAAWHPLDRPEQIQVEALAIAYWKLARFEREATLYLENLDPDKRLRFHAQIAQVQGSLERSYSRAQRDLERLQKTRALRAEKQDRPHQNDAAATTTAAPVAAPQPPAPAGQRPPAPPYVMTPASPAPPLSALRNGEQKAKIEECQ